MKRTHTNWSDNSKHSLRLIRRKKLQIVVSLSELLIFVAYWTMIPIFFPPDPDFLLVRSRFFISIEWQVWEQHFCIYIMHIKLTVFSSSVVDSEGVTYNR